MEIEATSIPGVAILRPRKFADERGFVSETFKAEALAATGMARDWVQDNHSYTGERGVMRGLHFQAPPHAQAKLVRVTHGAILDVALDIRKQSPTFGQAVVAELSAENWAQIFIPEGFAHGFCTLTPEVHVHYRMSAAYAPEAEGGVFWNDPDLNIPWPPITQLAPRDAHWPRLRDLKSPF